MKRVAIVLLILVGLAAVIGGIAFMQTQGAARARDAEAKKEIVRVKRDSIAVQVVETGTIDAVKVVEVKSRVSGRLMELYVDEGDTVKAGQLIALIDPQETELQVRQNQAQLRGSVSRVAQTDLEIQQRRSNVRSNLRQAEIRVAQLREELRAQPTLTESAVRSARASYDSALAEIRRLEASAHPNQRTAAESSVREAEANFANAQSEADRQRNLRGQGFVSEKVVENANLQLELARVRRQQARESQSRLESQLRVEMDRARDDVRRAQAELDRARANTIQLPLKRQELESALKDLEKARTALRDVDVLIQTRAQSQATVDQLRSVVDDGLRQLRETEIRAPMDGIVSRRFVQVGELVSGLSTFNSGTAIVRVEDRNALRVNLAVNEIDTARLSLRMPADITVDAFPGRIFRGEVRKIAPSSQAAAAAAVGAQVSAETVVKYPVEVWLVQSDAGLRTGMSAKVTLNVVKKDNVLVVPLEYIVKEGERAFVEKPANPKNPTAKRERIEVKLGIQTGAAAEIVSGLAEGQELGKPEFKGPARSGFIQTGPDGDEE